MTAPGFARSMAAMKLGILIHTHGDDPAIGALNETGRRLEGLGFDSIWTAQAIGRGRMRLDPLVTLAALATATTRVRLGTAILQLPLYAPAALANQVFSIMHLAGDRLVLGVGAGSSAPDFTVYESDFADRFARFEAGLARLRGLFATGRDGEADLTPWPRLVGGPPLYYGTWGRNVARAAAEFDGWIASAMKRTDEEAIAALARYREAGGDYAVVSTVILDPARDEAHNRGRLEAFAAAGFDEAVIVLPDGGPDPAAIRSWIPA